jgi:hypothetical protein
MNASNTPKIFVLAACVIFYSTLPAEAKGVWSSVRSVGATLTGDSEAYKTDEKATEDARAQGAAYAAERIAAETNQQTVQAFLAQNRKDALARQAEYEAEQTAQAEKAKAEDVAHATRNRDFAQKNFAVPFLAYLEQGTDPVEAYVQTMGQMETPDQGAHIHRLGNTIDIVRQHQKETEAYDSNRAWELKKIADPLAQREALKTMCNDIGSLCAPQIAAEISAKIEKYYEDKDKQVAFMQKNFAAPFLTFLEQGMEPFSAYAKAFENMAVVDQEIATDKQAKAEYYKKQLDALHGIKDPVDQRNEMAALCNDLSSSCEPETALKIKNKIEPYYSGIEEKIFMGRTNGRSLIGKDLDGFTLSNLNLTPAPDTVYPYRKGGSCFQLKVMQSVKDGVLIRGESLGSDFPDKNLFIKTKRQYADNDMLESGFFVYTGLAEYPTVLGVRAKVHSFEEIDDPKKDLFFY